MVELQQLSGDLPSIAIKIAGDKGGDAIYMIAILLVLAAQTADLHSQPATPADSNIANSQMTGAVEQAESLANAEGNAPQKINIPADTPVHLMTLTEVSTKTDTEGRRFKLRVNEDVVVAGKTVIAKGSLAWGEVTSAESSGNLGKGGRLTARLLYVDVNGQKVPIEGDTSAKGRTATAETVVGVLSLGLLGLFAKGNNAKIKAGEKITAFVAEDFELVAVGN